MLRHAFSGTKYGAKCHACRNTDFPFSVHLRYWVSALAHSLEVSVINKKAHRTTIERLVALGVHSNLSDKCWVRILKMVKHIPLWNFLISKSFPNELKLNLVG